MAASNLTLDICDKISTFFKDEKCKILIQYQKTKQLISTKPFQGLSKFVKDIESCDNCDAIKNLLQSFNEHLKDSCDLFSPGNPIESKLQEFASLSKEEQLKCAKIIKEDLLNICKQQATQFTHCLLVLNILAIIGLSVATWYTASEIKAVDNEIKWIKDDITEISISIDELKEFYEQSNEYSEDDINKLKSKIQTTGHRIKRTLDRIQLQKKRTVRNGGIVGITALISTIFLSNNIYVLSKVAPLVSGYYIGGLVTCSGIFTGLSGYNGYLCFHTISQYNELNNLEKDINRLKNELNQHFGNLLEININ